MPDLRSWSLRRLPKIKDQLDFEKNELIINEIIHQSAAKKLYQFYNKEKAHRNGAHTFWECNHQDCRLTRAPSKEQSIKRHNNIKFYYNNITRQIYMWSHQFWVGQIRSNKINLKIYVWVSLVYCGAKKGWCGSLKLCKSVWRLIQYSYKEIF